MQRLGCIQETKFCTRHADDESAHNRRNSWENGFSQAGTVPNTTVGSEDTSLDTELVAVIQGPALELRQEREDGRMQRWSGVMKGCP